MTTKEIENKLLKHFRFTQNIVVPRVQPSYKYVKFEQDILVITTSGYAYGVEIKISKSDLKNDLKKRHYKYLEKMGIDYWFQKLKHFYYCVTENILDETIKQVPEFCGILVVKNGYIKEYRPPKVIDNYKWSLEEKLHIAHLGAMRIFKNN